MSITFVGVCVGVFLLAQVSAGFDRFTFLQGAQQQELVAAGETWRLITAAFLHAGLTHLLFNMWALYVLGMELERRVGGLPYAALYMASAISGGVAYQLVGGSAPVVGASGAIFGLFGSWLVVAWQARDSAAGRAGLSQMLMLLAINLALPLFIPGIAWQAHLGGFAAGCVITAVWTIRSLRSTLARAGVATVVALAAFALGVA